MPFKPKEEDPRKVLKTIDQDDEQKSIIEESHYYWEKHPVVTHWFGRWKELIAWLYGNQYTWLNQDTGLIEDVSEDVEREFKNVYNRILPNIRQLHSEIIYPHSFYVEPNTSRGEDVKAAKLGSRVLEYTNLNGKFNVKMNNYAKLWAIVLGIAYWKEWWNKGLKGKIDDGKGGITSQPGDVDFKYVNPFNVRVSPGSLERDSWRWLIEGKSVPKIDIAREFGVHIDDIPADPLKPHDVDLCGMGEKPDARQDNVIRLERWQAPSAAYPKGRLMVSACGWIRYDGDTDPEGVIPYVQIPGIFPILNSPYSESAVKIAQPAQRQLNRYGSMIDEHIENYKLKAMIPRGSLDPGEMERYTRSGVDYVITNPTGAGTPYWQSPPPLPEIIMRWLQFMESEIQKETSVREVSYGQLPQYAQRASGILFDKMKGQDVSVLIPTSEAIEINLQDAMNIRLRLIQKHYTQKRLIKSTGRGKDAAEVFIKNTDLRDNTDVRVKSGVELFSQKNEKRSVVMGFVDKGVISMDEALEVLDYKGMEDIMEEKFIDKRYAGRIVEMIKDGKQPPMVMDHDNHQVHYDTYNAERKKEEFQTWKEKAKAFLLDRIDEHAEYLGIGGEPPEEGAGETIAGAGEGGAGALPPMPAAPVGGVAMDPAQLIAEMALDQTEGGE